MACPNEERCPREEGCPYPPTDAIFVHCIRDLYEYCPVVDMYFDEEKQEAYELSKIPKGKGRMKNRQRR